MIVTYSQLGKAGRCGNCLWEIASTLGLASKHQCRASFPRWEYQSKFSVPAHFFDGQPGVEATTLPEAAHIAPVHRTYLQDYSLWKDIAPTIIEYFQPSSEAKAVLYARHADLLKTPHKTAIHVRRGDYLQNPHIFPHCTVRYYERAMRRVLDESPETQFVLFSDDPNWCVKEIPKWMSPEIQAHAEKWIVMRGNKDWEDLFLQAECAQHVISNSTYSYWGATISRNPHPIYPKPWWGFPDYYESVAFPAGWIEIEC